MLRFYTSLAKYSPPGAGGYDRPEAQAAMTTGKLGMFIYGSWMQSALEQARPEVANNFGVVPVPTNGGDGGAFMGNLSLFAFKSSEHPKETKDFLAYMYDRDLYREFALLNPSAFIPVLAEVQGDASYRDDERVKGQKELLDAVEATLPNAWVFGLPNPHGGSALRGVDAVMEERRPAERSRADSGLHGTGAGDPSRGPRSSGIRFGRPGSPRAEGHGGSERASAGLAPLSRQIRRMGPASTARSSRATRHVARSRGLVERRGRTVVALS